ncbi:MAG: dihydroorotase [Rikenellaceae bacterium]
MSKTLIHNGTIVNRGEQFHGYVVIIGDVIESVGHGKYPHHTSSFTDVIDAKGSIVIPGVIDDQVHFRDYTMAYKADFRSESIAGVSGGVTSFMEMPNSNPPTITFEALDDKFRKASEVSPANYSFYFGATNDNLNLIEKIDPKRVCGVKVFLGSSTGNLLVDDKKILQGIFRSSPILVAIHSEKDSIIKENMRLYKEKYGDNITIDMHPLIRSAEACYASTYEAIEMAHKYGTDLHVLHLSTQRELELFENKPLEEKKITNEVCVHHLWFSDEDYGLKGNLIKWNPSIKSAADREALREGIKRGTVDLVATDHAPHTLEEKSRPYLDAPSGGATLEHSLTAMLQMADKEDSIFTIPEVVNKMCHAPALRYKIQGRGFLDAGYYADIAIVKMGEKWTVNKGNILSKCGWSPFEDYTFRNKVTHTFVNGSLAYKNGVVDSNIRGKELVFNR